MAQKITNKLAGLPQDVTIDRYEEHNKTIELFISYRPEERTCPYCKSHDCVIHSSGHTETVRHLGAGRNHFLLTFHVPRLRCKSCGMRRQTMYRPQEQEADHKCKIGRN